MAIQAIQQYQQQQQNNPQSNPSSPGSPAPLPNSGGDNGINNNLPPFTQNNTGPTVVQVSISTNNDLTNNGLAPVQFIVIPPNSHICRPLTSYGIPHPVVIGVIRRTGAAKPCLGGRIRLR